MESSRETTSHQANVEIQKEQPGTPLFHVLRTAAGNKRSEVMSGAKVSWQGEEGQRARITLPNPLQRDLALPLVKENVIPAGWRAAKSQSAEEHRKQGKAPKPNFFAVLGENQF